MFLFPWGCHRPDTNLHAFLCCPCSCFTYLPFFVARKGNECREKLLLPSSRSGSGLGSGRDSFFTPPPFLLPLVCIALRPSVSEFPLPPPATRPLATTPSGGRDSTWVCEAAGEDDWDRDLERERGTEAGRGRGRGIWPERVRACAGAGRVRGGHGESERH